MKSFFIVASNSGRPIPRSELDRFQAIVDRSINYAGFIRSSHSLSGERGDVCLVALTNEPEVAPVLAGDDTVFALSGDCDDVAALQDLRPTARLARDISGITGRFSVVVMDKRSGAVAVANSAVRIDSIFAGQSREFHYIGTQASVICRLLHGELQYDVDALYTLISTGFFGTDATSFRGVSVLPPLTAWVLDGGAVSQHTTHLAELKRSEQRLDDHVDDCLDAYLDAVKPLARGTHPVQLALSGGKDSRLVLVALRRAGIDVHCRTYDRGADNSADVHVATELAKLLHVSHRVTRASVESSAEGPTIRVDLLGRTAEALRASDGAVFGYDRGVFRPEYSRQINLTGHGGEIMRGGYAEHHEQAGSPREVLKIVKRIFAPLPRLFTPDANVRYVHSLTRWVEDHAARMPPLDVLDCLYVYFRCGRWVAGTSRGTTTSAARLFPFLDNRVTLAMVRAPAAHKVRDQLIRGIVRRVDAIAADFPLAKKHWRDADKDERRRMEKAHPAAYATAGDKASLDWRLHLGPPVLEHVRRYCLDDGRVELLSSILDMAAVQRFLRGQEAGQPARRRVLFGLYAACVLTCGDWMATPFPSAPIRVQISRPSG